MKRACEHLLRTRLRQFPCVVLTGARQCGKTTLTRILGPGWKRFDLEKGQDLEFLSRDPDLFFRLNPRHIVIDEAQRLPALFPALRVAIDDRRSARGRFVVTGSSAPTLIRPVTESLAGRAATIEMSPFSLAEAFGKPFHPLAQGLSQKNPRTDLLALTPRWTLAQVHRFWLRGGYPEPWLRRAKGFRDVWMEEYVQAYLQRDVGRLFPGLNQERFFRFLKFLSFSSGDIINYSDVGRSLAISDSTAQDYFDIAHGTFVWRRLPAFARRAAKRVVRHPRGYVRDPGLLHHFLRIPDISTLLTHPRMGPSWEGFVIEEVLRGLDATGIPHEASYYRTGAGAEVDLVLEGHFGLIPVEIKHAQTLSHYALRSLNLFIEEQKCPFGLVIHNGEKVQRLSDKIIALPAVCL